MPKDVPNFNCGTVHQQEMFGLGANRIPCVYYEETRLPRLKSQHAHKHVLPTVTRRLLNAIH